MAYPPQLNINKYLEECNSNDVVSMRSKHSHGLFYIWKLINLISPAQIESFLNIISQQIAKGLGQEVENKLWFDEGKECEILRADSKGWQKGKIKLKVNFTLEFIPDEAEKTESPLDDVRQELNNSNL